MTSRTDSGFPGDVSQAEAEELAALLPGFHAEPVAAYWYFVLADEQGHRLHVSVGNRLRYEISGLWPEGYRRTFSPSDQLSIGVARYRGPAAVAKEIQRRFLPWYLPEFERRAEMAHCYARRFEEAQSVLRRLCDAVGKPIRDQNGLEITVYRHGVRRIKVNDSSSVELELCSLTPEAAMEVLTALRSNMPAQPR